MPTLQRNTNNHVHANVSASPYLLDDRGVLTSFKRCVSPQEHKIATYYRREAQLYACYICHEGINWLQQNLWRFPDDRQKIMVAMLNLAPIATINSTMSLDAEPPFFEESGIKVSPKIEAASSVLSNVVEASREPQEYCSCGEVGEYVGMDGESLCKRCWSLMLEIIKR